MTPYSLVQKHVLLIFSCRDRLSYLCLNSARLQSIPVRYLVEPPKVEGGHICTTIPPIPKRQTIPNEDLKTKFAIKPHAFLSLNGQAVRSRSSSRPGLHLPAAPTGSHDVDAHLPLRPNIRPSFPSSQRNHMAHHASHPFSACFPLPQKTQQQRHHSEPARRSRGR